MASAVQRRPSQSKAGPEEPRPTAAQAPAAPTDATLAFTTHTEYLTRDNVRQMLPKLLQQVVSPSEDTKTAISRAQDSESGLPQSVQGMLVAAHFATDAQMSHPLGYAVGSSQIASLLSMLAACRR